MDDLHEEGQQDQQRHQSPQSQTARPAAVRQSVPQHQRLLNSVELSPHVTRVSSVMGSFLLICTTRVSSVNKHPEYFTIH